MRLALWMIDVHDDKQSQLIFVYEAILSMLYLLEGTVIL